MKIVPPTNWTMEKKGAKRVEIAVIDNDEKIDNSAFCLCCV